MSRDSSGILIMTPEQAVAERVRSALAGDPRFGPARTCQNLLDLISHLERQPAEAAIVDLDPHPRKCLTDLDPIIVRFPDTRFVLIASSPQPELVVEAMTIGARHLLGKDTIGQQLAAVLGRLVPGHHASAGVHGTMVTVLSTGGGCGATSIAINLASELQDTSDGSILLVDFDVACGGIALALGLRGQYGIADVLAHGSIADPELVRSSAVPTGSMSVLLSPASIQFAAAPALAWQNLPPVLVACKLGFANTIIDAPRLPVPVAATLASASDATLIVMQLCVKDIQIARDLRQGLLDHGVEPEKLITVVNRYNRRHNMVTVEQAQRALQSNHFELITNDFPAVSRGINYGQPLADAAPRSPVRKDIRQLLARLALQVGSVQVSGG